MTVVVVNVMIMSSIPVLNALYFVIPVINNVVTRQEKIGVVMINMPRYEESKIPELDERMEKLEKKVKELKVEDEEIKEVNFVEVLFDPAKFKVGQEKVNLLLSSNKNTHIFKQFQTESGLVIEIGTWGKKSNEKLS